MYYPYEEAEQAAKQNPPPSPPADEFPTAATVIALYGAWVLFMGRKFDAPDVASNARETIARVSHSNLIAELHQKWRRAKAGGEEKKYINSSRTHADEARRYAALAWDSYQKNLKNTVLGTCAGAVARRELGKLSPESLIKWLPSSARERDMIHLSEYYNVMTAHEALQKELCIRIGCKCGWQRV